MIDYEQIIKGQRLTSWPIQSQLLPLWAIGIAAALHTTGMVFIGYNQNHMCTMPRKQEIIQKCNMTWTEQETRQYIPWNSDTESYDSCTRYVYDFINCTFWSSNSSQIPANDGRIQIEKCDSWTYDTSVFTTTVLGDFDLVCDDKQKGRISQAIFMLGVLVGVTAWGQFSDRFGRKVCAVTTLAIGTGVGIATAFSNSFALFTTFRFFIGFLIFPSSACCYVLELEIVESGKKTFVGQTFEAIFAVGICTLSGIAYFARDWRTLQLLISAPSIILILWIQCCVCESPRWLISRNQYAKADKIVKKLLSNEEYHRNDEAKKLRSLCKKKREEKDFKGHKVTGLEEEVEVKRPQSETDKSTVLEIFKLPNMRKKSVILFYMWMVVSAAYYGLTLNSADLGGNAFVNLVLSAIVEIPAAYIALPMMNRWGRRPTLSSALCLSGVVCICMMFVSKDMVWLNVMLSTAGKFSISTAFGTLYIYAIEIYPTPVRNVGLGVCSSWARVGGMLAPFIAMLDVVGFAAPYVAFGLMAVIAGLLGLLLPETLGKTIPETLEEAEQFGKHYEGIIALVCGEENSANAKRDVVE